MTGPQDGLIEAHRPGQTPQRQYEKQCGHSECRLEHGQGGKDKGRGDECRNIPLVPLSPHRHGNRTKQNHKRDQTVRGHRSQGSIMADPCTQHDLTINQCRQDYCLGSQPMNIGCGEGRAEPVTASQYTEGNHGAKNA